MFVSEYMTRRVRGVSPDCSTAEALEVMRGEGFEALPVVTAKGDLAGIVTEHDILVKLSQDPSSEFLGATTVRQVMAPDVVSIGEGEIVESAAYIMKQNDFSALPVVDEEGQLTGIITQADIFGVLVRMMGLTEPGTRITLVIPDRRGMLADIASIIKQHKVSIASVATIAGQSGKMGHAVFRVRTIEADPIVNALVEAGMRVVHVSQIWE